MDKQTASSCKIYIQIDKYRHSVYIMLVAHFVLLDYIFSIASVAVVVSTVIAL